MEVWNIRRCKHMSIPSYSIAIHTSQRGRDWLGIWIYHHARRIRNRHLARTPGETTLLLINNAWLQAQQRPASPTFYTSTGHTTPSLDFVAFGRSFKSNNFLWAQEKRTASQCIPITRPLLPQIAYQSE